MLDVPPEERVDRRPATAAQTRRQEPWPPRRLASSSIWKVSLSTATLAVPPSLPWSRGPRCAAVPLSQAAEQAGTRVRDRT